MRTGDSQTAPLTIRNGLIEADRERERIAIGVEEILRDVEVNRMPDDQLRLLELRARTRTTVAGW